MIQIIISITTIIIANYALTKLWSKIKIPTIITMIIVWLLINIPFVNKLILQGETENLIKFLGDIGLISLMLIAGIWSSIKKMEAEKKESLVISILGLTTPFLLWIWSMLLFWYDIQVAIITGIAISITAEATTAKILFDSKKIKSKIWTAMLEAWIIDDIIGLVAFITIGFILKTIHTTDYLLITTSIFAFFLGAFIKKHLWRKFHWIKKIEKWLNMFIIPFLFINIGINFNFSTILTNIPLLLTIITVEFWWKFIWTMLSHKFTHFSRKQTRLIARAMNSRCAIWLAIILIAFQVGILPIEIYSTIVIWAIITTIAFPFAYDHITKKNPGIME